MNIKKQCIGGVVVAHSPTEFEVQGSIPGPGLDIVCFSLRDTYFGFRAFLLVSASLRTFYFS